MEYNPALGKYEPILPLKKTNKKLKIKVDWKWIIIILLSAAIITGFIIKNIFVK